MGSAAVVPACGRRPYLPLSSSFRSVTHAPRCVQSLPPQALAAQAQAASATYVLPMPKWQERESTLLRRLQRHEGVEDKGIPAAASAGSAASMSAALTGSTDLGPAPPAFLVRGPDAAGYVLCWAGLGRG